MAAVSARLEGSGRGLCVRGVTGQEATRMAVAMALEVIDYTIRSKFNTTVMGHVFDKEHELLLVSVLDCLRMRSCSMPVFSPSKQD